MAKRYACIECGEEVQAGTRCTNDDCPIGFGSTVPDVRPCEYCDAVNGSRNCPIHGGLDA